MYILIVPYSLRPWTAARPHTWATLHRIDSEGVHFLSGNYVHFLLVHTASTSLLGIFTS